jgi:hypothetical protein
MSSRVPLLVLVCLLLASSVSLAAEERVPFSFNVSSPILSFPFRIKDAEFSSSLNAIVAVSESPNQLHIYRPDTDELVSVNLQVPPYCVSVSPDGHSAAVGHNGWISHVDLDNATLVQTIPVSTVLFDIVMGANGWVYGFPETGSFPPVYSVNVTTGAQSQSTGWMFNRTVARLHPGGQSMYGADTTVSPADIRKFTITIGGPAETANDSPYHGDYAMCGNLWLSVDGQRIYTACGNVFRASADANQDMRYVGSFSQPVTIEWAANTQTGSNIAVLPAPPNPSADGEIKYFTPDFLLYRGRALLPRFVVGQNTWAAHGRWVFFNAAGTKQYVVVQADAASALTADFGLVTVDCTSASVSFNPPGASFGTSFATAQFAVTGSPGCGWTSTSNVPWLNTNSSGVGDGTVTYTVAANTGYAPRSGTISVSGQPFAVSQAGVVPTSLVATATSPTSVSLTWSFSAAADHFEVWRSSGAGFALVGSPGTAVFSDTTAADTGYVYKVRAVDGGGAMSGFSAPDFTHTFTLSDPALTAGMTIRAVHVTDLRTAVNAVRAAAALPPATFTDSPLGSAVAQYVHVAELRDAINGVRTALGLPPQVFPPLAPGDLIRASTTEELRAAIR